MTTGTITSQKFIFVIPKNILDFQDLKVVKLNQSAHKRQTQLLMWKKKNQTKIEQKVNYCLGPASESILSVKF